MNYIFVKNLSVHYPSQDQIKALKEVNLSVESGQIHGFLGPNGAGKTTMIKVLTGIIPQYTGEAKLFDQSPTSIETHKRIGFMPEIANYYWYLTPRELLTMFGQLFRIPKAELSQKIEELLKMVDLTKAGNQLMKTFSKGMVQRVSFAQAMINDPDLLILDEPTSGLDPLSRIQMRDIILSLRNKGKTIFFSSHELSEVELICDSISIIKDGTILKSGKREELLANRDGSVSLEQFFLEIIK